MEYSVENHIKKATGRVEILPADAKTLTSLAGISCHGLRNAFA